MGRARQQLNQDTIKGMQDAFRRGGQKAIDRVMRTKPDVFLKLLCLLVPREMQIEHKGGVKAMTDEELERGMEAIQAMLDAKAKVIDGEEPRCSITSNVSRRDQSTCIDICCCATPEAGPRWGTFV
jgi:hypothetical protein